MKDSVGVYISVPFCRAKCTYCNFASGVFGPERMDRYVERVCTEVRGARLAVERMGAELPGRADTIFFGGGTPSLLGAGQMRKIFEAVRGELEVAADAEVTLECAPGQMGEETLDEMLRQGMNRVSFGVQSFVDREAAAVGRLHTREMCLAEIQRMRAAGVTNINVDLIVGLPLQTSESWRESVQVAVQSRVPHVSVYMLEVDEDSRLGREMLADGVRYGAGAAPSEDETAEWYGAACEWLKADGIGQYEISNFAREGFASRHNVKYWRRDPYVGFGLDAHSMLRSSEGAVRWANTSDLDGYMAGEGREQGTGNREQGTGKREQGSARTGNREQGTGNREQGSGLIQTAAGANLPGFRVGSAPEVEVVGREQAFEEAMFLGLRLNEGVDLEDLRTEFGEGLMREAVAALSDVEEAGLVVVEGGRVRLTGRGRVASNEVFSRLLVGATV